MPGSGPWAVHVSLLWDAQQSYEVLRVRAVFSSSAYQFPLGYPSPLITFLPTPSPKKPIVLIAVMIPVVQIKEQRLKMISNLLKYTDRE